MSNISEWSTTAASNSQGSPDGFPENMAPSGVNDSAREVMAAVARWYQDSQGTLTSAGTKAAYTLTTNNAHAALSDVTFTVFEAHTASTAAPTLNIDSTGAKTLKKQHDVSLAANDIEAGQLVAVAYNSTDDVYEMLNPPAAISGVPLTGVDISSAATAATVNTANDFLPIFDASESANRQTSVSSVIGKVSTETYAAKFWVKFDGSDGTVDASYNVTGVSRTAAGDYTITLTTAFSSANYAAVATALNADSAVRYAQITALAAGTLDIQVFNQDTTKSDPTSVLIVGFGAQ